MLGFLFIAAITLVVLRQFLYHHVRRKWGTIDRRNEISVEGKVVIVTGANTGIGKTTVKEMADRGATVVLACRNEAAATAAIQDIRRQTPHGVLISMKLDLASLKSVREFAVEFKNRFTKLDILINNAGISTPARHKLKSKDGFEIHFATNHLGHFLLTNLLLDQVKAAAPSRILTLTSFMHCKGEIDFADLMSEKKNYKDDITKLKTPLYSNSKLANVLFNMELGKRLEGTGVQTYALCPGIVTTDISRTQDIPFFARVMSVPLGFTYKTPTEGTMTTLFCALSKHKDVMMKTGEMYQHCAYWDPAERIALNDQDATRLWEESMKLVGLQQ